MMKVSDRMILINIAIEATQRTYSGSTAVM